MERRNETKNKQILFDRTERERRSQTEREREKESRREKHLYIARDRKS